MIRNAVVSTGRFIVMLSLVPVTLAAWLLGLIFVTLADGCYCIIDEVEKILTYAEGWE
jgi:hypothetical protein